MALNFDHIWSKIGPQQNRTKCPEWRAKNLYDKATDIIDRDVEGDFVEVGTWKGGMCALLGFLAEKEGKGRRVWAFDSFEGMSESDVDIDGAETRAPERQLRNFDLSDFRTTCFDIMGLNSATIMICPGWLDSTLPEHSMSISDISILRLDVDWWEPTKLSLDYLYPKVVTGGFVICDDYGYWKGARKAIDDYRQENNITSEMVQTKNDAPDLKIGTEHWWQK